MHVCFTHKVFVVNIPLLLPIINSIEMIIITIVYSMIFYYMYSIPPLN